MVSEIIPDINSLRLTRWPAWARWLVPLTLFLIPFSWFHGEKMVLGGEILTYPDPKISFLNHLHCWDPAYGFGVPNLNITAMVYNAFSFLSSWAFGVPYAQKLLFGLFLALSFLSMRSLLGYLLNTTSPLSREIGALFYVFNPFFVMMFPWVPSYGFLFMVAPLILKESMIILDGRGTMANDITLFVFGFVYSVTALNLALFGLIFILISGYFFVGLLKMDHNNIKQTVVFSKILGLLLAANFFWLWPILSQLASLFGGAVVYVSNFSKTSLFDSPILKALTLNEYYWFDKSDGWGELLFGYSVWYQWPSILILLGLIGLCILGGGIEKRNFIVEGNRRWLYFSFLFILGVFFTKGTAEPLGFFHRMLLAHFKPWGIFRASDIKFPFLVVVSLSFFLTYGLDRFKNWRKAVSVGVLFSLLFLGSPFVFGLIFQDSKEGTRSMTTSIPTNWKNYSLWANQTNLSDRALLIPRNNGPHDSYRWGYDGCWLRCLLVQRSTVANTAGYGHSTQEHRFGLVNFLYDFLESDDTESAVKLARLFGVTEILFREDTNSIGALERFFEGGWFPFIKEVHVFGNLRSYSLRENFANPLLYLPNGIVVSNSLTLKGTILDPKFDPRSVIAFQEDLDRVACERLKTIQDDGPTHVSLEFQRMSPTKMIASVRHAPLTTLPLVFNESFHDEWRLFLRPPGRERNPRPFDWFKKAIPEKMFSHFMANGFGNAWFLDVGSLRNQYPNYFHENADKTVDFDFIIEYQPQQWLLLGSVVSGLVFVFLLLSWSLSYKKKLKHLTKKCRNH